MTIAELYDTLYKDSLLPRNGFCESVDAHFYLFDFSKTITDAEEYDQTLRILSDYGIILSQNKEARISQRVVLRSLALFENHPTIKHSELVEIKHYESLIFTKAENLYYLKKYVQSRKILKNLITHFPENKMYKRSAVF